MAGLIEPFGQLEAGRSAQESAEYNAAVARNEAVTKRQKARFEQVRQAKEGSRIKGTMAARAGKTGARTDVGSPVLVAAEQAAELELDNLLIGFEGETMARKHESQAKIDVFSGKVARRASQLKAFSTVVKNASTGARAGMGG